MHLAFIQSYEWIQDAIITVRRPTQVHWGRPPKVGAKGVKGVTTITDMARLLIVLIGPSKGVLTAHIHGRSDGDIPALCTMQRLQAT